jgi:hypothetical protein
MILTHMLKFKLIAGASELESTPSTAMQARTSLAIGIGIGMCLAICVVTIKIF